MDTTNTALELWSDTSDAGPSEDFETARPEFKATRHGYDQDQVNDYLARVTGRLHDVEAKVQRLRSEADQTRQQLDLALQERDAARQERDAASVERPAASEDTYEQVSSRVMELMLALNRDVEKLREEAQGEAEHMLARASSKASRMRSEAKEVRAAADLAAAQTREEAEQSVANLMTHRDSMVADLRLSFARSLDTIGSLASSIGDENEIDRRDGVEPKVTSLTGVDQASPLVELSFDRSVETISNLASSIGEEERTGA